ncbi:hypothetical protein HDU97_008882 [Phlyctochytrium planicorne]|nr:hypothetical protein HDU97_008882 [Phlyctochytrium planicorne]
MSDGGQREGDISPYSVHNGSGQTSLDQAQTTPTSATGKVKVDHPTVALGESLSNGLKYLADALAGPSNSLAGKADVAESIVDLSTQSKEIQLNILLAKQLEGSFLGATKQVEGSLNSSIKTLRETMKESMTSENDALLEAIKNVHKE